MAFVLCVDAQQHLGDYGAETDVNQGQGLRGRRSTWGCGGWEFENDGQDDEQVAKHSDQVHGQEQPKYKGLQFWVLREPKEDKEL